MIKIFTCCALALLGYLSSTAQKTIIGAEIAVASDFTHIDDAAGNMTKPDLTAALVGIKVRHLVADPLFLETGLYTRIYREGFMFKDEFGVTITGRRTIMLPLRAGLRFQLFNKKLSVNPVAGLVLGLADGQEAGSGYNEGGDPNVGVHYEFDMQYPVQAFTMLQGGLNIDLRIFKKAFLSFTGNYYHGMEKLWVQNMRYTKNGGPVNNARSYSKGSFYAVGIGFNYELK